MRLFSDQTHTSIAGRKRFYKQVNIRRENSGGFAVLLDSRTLNTPQRNPLLLPNEALALCVAAEWDAQVDKKNGIQPATMPMMTLAATAIDQVQKHPAYTIDHLMRYLHTDSALFFTSEDDRLLLQKQRRHFQPALDWAGRGLGLHLGHSDSMSGRIVHPHETVARVRGVVESLDSFSLTALQCATMESKSLLLALALLAREYSLEKCIAASRVEEEFQIEIWGVVEGGHDMDRLNNAVSLSSVDTFMRLLWDEARCKSTVRAWVSPR